jgi:hypothetical protein
MMVGSRDRLQSETGYIDARPRLPDRQNLLQRTAGPYIRVTTRRTQVEHIKSASPLKSGRRAVTFKRSAIGPVALLSEALPCVRNFPVKSADCRILQRKESGRAAEKIILECAASVVKFSNRELLEDGESPGECLRTWSKSLILLRRSGPPPGAGRTFFAGRTLLLAHVLIAASRLRRNMRYSPTSAQRMSSRNAR